MADAHIARFTEVGSPMKCSDRVVAVNRHPTVTSRMTDFPDKYSFGTTWRIKKKQADGKEP